MSEEWSGILANSKVDLFSFIDLSN